MSGEQKKCYKCEANAVFICKTDELMVCENVEHLTEHLNETNGMIHHEMCKLGNQFTTDLGDAENDQKMLIEVGVPIHPYTFPVSCLAIQGPSLFVAEKDGVSKFDLSTKIQLWKAFTKSTVWHISLSPDGSMLALALDDGFLEILNPTNGIRMNSLKPFTDSSATIVSFTSNSNYLISCSSKGYLCLFNSPSFTIFSSNSLYNSAILSSSTSQNNRFIFCGASTGEIGVFNVHTKQTKLTKKVHKSVVTSLVCTKSGFLVSAGIDGMICKWNSETAEFIQEICCFAQRIYSMTLNPGSQEIYFTDSKLNINTLNLETRKTLKSAKIERDMVSGIVFDADRNLIYGIFGNRTVIAIQPSTFQIQGFIGNTGLLMARTTLDKKYLVCGFSDGWVKFFNLSTSRIDHEFYYKSGSEIFNQYEELGISIEII